MKTYTLPAPTYENETFTITIKKDLAMKITVYTSILALINYVAYM
jgi:hypothetical protein